MTPAFRIVADDIDITRKIADRLIAIEVTDEAGLASDAVEIVLDDRDGLVALPEIGSELAVWLGYEETGLTFMGRYRIDEVALDAPPSRMTVSASAIDTGSRLKEHKTRAWEDVTLGDIVRTVAGEHGLTPRIPEQLAQTDYPHIDQTSESDLHFLTRLGRDHGAIAAVKDSNLVFARRGEGRSIGGKAMPARTLTPKDVASWRMTFAERGRFKSVIAMWHSVEGAQKETLTAGEGTPVFRLMHVYSSKSNARRAAAAKLASLLRSADGGDIALDGDPSLVAESRVILEGFREGVSGEWSVTKAMHRLSDGGFVSTLDLEAPEQ